MRRSDSELVERAVSGDIESFRELYERYYSLAVGIALSRVFDQHLAEDAAQEAFATACRRLYSLKDGSNFPAWLGTICRRHAIKLSRTAARTRPIDQDPISPMSTEEPVEQRIRNALETLSPDAREVIQLHYFTGLSYEEIGKVLNVSTSAVHGRLQRARRLLHVQLSDSDERVVCDE